MNRLVYFLMVGLAFTVLQVSTVAAQTGGPGSMAPMDINSSDPCMVVPPGPGRDSCYGTPTPTPGS